MTPLIPPPCLQTPSRVSAGGAGDSGTCGGRWGLSFGAAA